MIAPMAKKAAKGDGGKDRKGDVTKQDVSEFIGELQNLLADARSVLQIFERPGIEAIETDGVGMGSRGVALCGVYLANIRRASHRRR